MSDCPADFVRQYYGRWKEGCWDPAGLTLADLKRDPSLYTAYRSWIRSHPEDDLKLPTTGPRAHRQKQRVQPK